MNKSKSTSSSPAVSSTFFRCPVSEDRSSATIRIGRRGVTASVQETSIDGFTVLVSPSFASRLKVGRPWVLEHDGTRVEVHPQWMFNGPDGHVQLGLRRLRDLTTPPPLGRSMAKARTRIHSDSNYSAVAFGGFVLALFALMALPGLGDRLGTSDRIQNAFKWIVSEARITIDQIL
jgi:hypothetical protein